MKYTPNYRLREISQILSPELWQELETRAFTRGGCTKQSKDEDQNLELAARALALELPVGMDLWGQLKTMVEFVEQCRVYANNASRAKSLSLPTYEAYLSAIPDSGKREPYPSVLENMWMLHPNWNGLRLRQFESDKETEMLKAELAALVQPNWAKPQPLSETANVRGRWNIELDGDDLLVCFNDHDKGESCSYQRYVPAQQAKLAKLQEAHDAWKRNAELADAENRDLQAMMAAQIEDLQDQLTKLAEYIDSRK